jgi:hypothetical protein
LWSMSRTQITTWSLSFSTPCMMGGEGVLCVIDMLCFKLVNFTVFSLLFGAV